MCYENQVRICKEGQLTSVGSITVQVRYKICAAQASLQKQLYPNLSFKANCRLCRMLTPGLQVELHSNEKIYLPSWNFQLSVSCSKGLFTISPGLSANPPVSSSWQAKIKQRSFSLSIQCNLPIIFRDASTHHE